MHSPTRRPPKPCGAVGPKAESRTRTPRAHRTRRVCARIATRDTRSRVCARMVNWTGPHLLVVLVGPREPARARVKVAQPLVGPGELGHELMPAGRLAAVVQGPDEVPARGPREGDCCKRISRCVMKDTLFPAGASLTAVNACPALATRGREETRFAWAVYSGSSHGMYTAVWGEP